MSTMTMSAVVTAVVKLELLLWPPVRAELVITVYRTFSGFLAIFVKTVRKLRWYFVQTLQRNRLHGWQNVRV